MIRFLLGLGAFVLVLVPVAFALALFGGPVLGLAGVLAVPVLVALATAALPVVLVLAVVVAVVSVIGALIGAVFSLALFAIKALLFVVAPIAVLGYLATRLLAAST